MKNYIDGLITRAGAHAYYQSNNNCPPIFCPNCFSGDRDFSDGMGVEGFPKSHVDEICFQTVIQVGLFPLHFSSNYVVLAIFHTFFWFS